MRPMIYIRSSKVVSREMMIREGIHEHMWLKCSFKNGPLWDPQVGRLTNTLLSHQISESN